MEVSLGPVLDDLRQRLRGLYGRRLRGIYIYGSRARGDAQTDSDLDVLIVLDEVTDYPCEISRTSELVAAVSLTHGIAVSRVFASERQWLEDATMFFVNVRREAVPA